MKHYWKSMLIGLFALLSIGVFYIQSSFAANSELNVHFKKTAGDENEVKSIVLSGDYQIGDRAERLEITDEKTGYPEQLTFLQQLEKMSVPSGFEETVKIHKAFMRGKNVTAECFFENEETLAYAEIQAKKPYVQPMENLVLAVEILDKQSNEIESMKFDVPKRENYSYMSVEKIQVAGNELRVVVQSILRDDSAEYHAYTIQLEEKKLAKDHVIASVAAEEDGWSDLQIVNSGELANEERYLLIRSSERYTEDNAPDKSLIDEYFNEYTIYDVENNVSKKVELPKGTFDLMPYAVAVYDASIVVPAAAPNGIEVSRYDIENDSWAEAVQFESAEVKADENPYMKVLNGKLYAVFSIDEGPVLFIGDLTTGELLYKGLLEAEGGVDDGRLYIFDVAER